MTDADTALSPYAQGLMPPGRATGSPARLRPGGGDLTCRAIAAGGWRAGHRVLDLGCGNGESLATLHRLGIDAVGLDLVLPPDAAVPVIRGRGEDLPFPSSCFDGVLAECSLSVMDDPEAALAEVARVLKPGASLVAADVYGRGTVTDPRSLPPCLSGVVSGDELKRRLTRAGLVSTLWEDHSETLKRLIGQVLFEHGSLTPLWGDSPSDGNTGEAIRQLRPGYLLLAAIRPRLSEGRDLRDKEPGHG